MRQENANDGHLYTELISQGTSLLSPAYLGIIPSRLGLINVVQFKKRWKGSY